MKSEALSKFPVTISAATNDAAILATCLHKSPDIILGSVVLNTYEGFSSAARAYNRALDEAKTDVVVLVHQDVYLPAGFLAGLSAALLDLAARDPDWAVVGVIGLTEGEEVVGQTWSSGLRQLVGQQVSEPTAVITLDEVLLVVRRSSGVRFDENMPGFHLYAADVVLSASIMNLSSYVLHLPIIHHSRPVIYLDAGYRRAYRFMQGKWRARLPVPNLICPITRSNLPLIFRDARLRWINRGRRDRDAPSSDPAAIARQLGME